MDLSSLRKAKQPWFMILDNYPMCTYISRLVQYHPSSSTVEIRRSKLNNSLNDNCKKDRSQILQRPHRFTPDFPSAHSSAGQHFIILQWSVIYCQVFFPLISHLPFRDYLFKIVSNNLHLHWVPRNFRAYIFNILGNSHASYTWFPSCHFRHYTKYVFPSEKSAKYENITQKQFLSAYPSRSTMKNTRKRQCRLPFFASAHAKLMYCP